MKRPNFQEKTEVKVVNKDCIDYGQRGTVTELKVDIDGKTINPVVDKEQLKQAYADGLEPKMTWYARVKFANDDGNCWFRSDELEAVQHKFIDIDYIREDDLIIGKKADGTDAIRPKNTGAFKPGDIIQITTKIDGANASIAWDETTGKLEIFSRTNLLDSPGALRGFYDYIKTEVEPKYDRWNKLYDYVVFGEWEVHHNCNYNKDVYNKWYVYDIWSRSLGRYLKQDAVKKFCKELKLNYIEELYYGPFISWDHCRSFIGKSKAYGLEQEGIVIKNQDAIVRSAFGIDVDGPTYIKIVDEKFKEAQHSKKLPKEIDPAKEDEKQKAVELAQTIVTEARVRKLILKLIDDGKLPAELKPMDMGAVMKQLPRLVFNDVVKEEPEIVKLLGEYAGKFIATETAKQARKIVIGN